MLGSVNRSLSPQNRELRTHGFDLRICEIISYRKCLRICVKKLKSTANPQSSNTAGIVSLHFAKKSFYGSMYRKIWWMCLLRHYNTPLPNFAAVELLFSMSAAFFTAIQASLTSRNLILTACFSEGSLSFLK